MPQLQSAPEPSANGIRDMALRQQLLSRRERLQSAMPVASVARQNVVQLLQQVDAALERMDRGTFGICETCHDPIESDRLLADPLTRYCIDHLSASERAALQHDLDVASEVQRGLLPAASVSVDGWAIAYEYRPAGAVSGDYCDLINLGGRGGLVLIGDVTGKGVAASMLMAQLHAIFRTLAEQGCSPAELVRKANRIFGQGTLPSHFATLVCARLQPDGNVDVCNAGHCLPLRVHPGGIDRIQSTGLPLGLLNEADYTCERVLLARGDSLVLYSDGISEAFNPQGEQYGVARLADVLSRNRTLLPRELLRALLADLSGFRAGTVPNDDLTLMVLHRVAHT